MDFQRALTIITNKPGNRTCADCSTKNPRWVSISLGVFVCIRCCGMHRNLGTHISKMKSVTLDKWQPDWIRVFDSLDNELSNRFWERNLPSNFRKPTESSTTFEVESFIRDKYEFKRWVPDGEPDPVSAVLTGKAKAKTEKKPEVAPVPVPEPKVREVTMPSAPMVDLLAVEPTGPPKPEYVIDWSAPQMTQFPQVQPTPTATLPVQSPARTTVPMHPAPPLSTLLPSTQPIRTPQSAPVPQIAYPVQADSTSQTRENNIKSIMSMYGMQGGQSQGTTSVQQPAFRPLGAIAAEQMFRGNAGRGGYPGQQWPSF